MAEKPNEFAERVNKDHPYDHVGNVASAIDRVLDPQFFRNYQRVHTSRAGMFDSKAQANAAMADTLWANADTVSRWLNSPSSRWQQAFLSSPDKTRPTSEAELYHGVVRNPDTNHIHEVTTPAVTLVLSKRTGRTGIDSFEVTTCYPTTDGMPWWPEVGVPTGRDLTEDMRRTSAWKDAVSPMRRLWLLGCASPATAGTRVDYDFMRDTVTIQADGRETGLGPSVYTFGRNRHRHDTLDVRFDTMVRGQRIGASIMAGPSTESKLRRLTPYESGAVIELMTLAERVGLTPRREPTLADAPDASDETDIIREDDGIDGP